MSDNIFGYTDSMKAPLGKTFSADGKVYMYAVAHANLTAKTPYLVLANEYGAVTGATTATHGGYIGVPTEAVTSGDVAKMQIGGLVTDMITPSLSISVGHACSIASSVVADTGADYIGAAAEFAVCTTASTTSTTQDVMLVPKFVTCG